jgi:hypothetical protein
MKTLLLICALFLAGCNSNKVTLQYVYDEHFVDSIVVIKAAQDCGLDMSAVENARERCGNNSDKLWRWQQDTYAQCRKKVPGYVDYQGIRSRMVLLECWKTEYQDELDKLLERKAGLQEWEQRMRYIIDKACVEMKAKYGEQR